MRKTVETFDGSGWSISADRVFVWYNWLMLDELDITASGGVWSVADGSTAGVATASVRRKFAWGLDLAGLSGQVNSIESAGGIGGLLAMRNLAETPNRAYVYFADGNGNVTQAIKRAGGTIAAKYECDAYGNNLLDASDPNESGPLAGDNPFRFSTKYHDGELDDPATVADEGTYYYGYRHYLPRIWRWGSEDPIGLNKHYPNVYTAFANAPAVGLDPDGRRVWWPLPPAPRRPFDILQIWCTGGTTGGGPGYHCFVICRSAFGHNFRGDGTGPGGGGSNPEGNGDPGWWEGPGNTAGNNDRLQRVYHVPVGTCECIRQKGRALNRVRDKHYCNLTSNSNSALCLILRCCGVSVAAPDVWAPGWCEPVQYGPYRYALVNCPCGVAHPLPVCGYLKCDDLQ